MTNLPVDVVEKYADNVMTGMGLKHAQTREIVKVFLNYLAVFEQRHTKYGPDNISKFGEHGCLVRLYDKVSRLIHQEEVADETIGETWVDAMGYAVIALVVRAGRWDSYEGLDALEADPPEAPKGFVHPDTSNLRRAEFMKCPICLRLETECHCHPPYTDDLSKNA